jgi:hypothetical protein
MVSHRDTVLKLLLEPMYLDGNEWQNRVSVLGYSLKD